MSDITAKYRTKYPPKEHEEAVKMLLHNITRQQIVETQQQADNSSRRFDSENRDNRDVLQVKRIISSKKMQDLIDCRSLNSTDQEELESSSSGNISGGNKMVKSLNEGDLLIPRMKSKSTSTNDSVSMISSDQRTDSISIAGSGLEESIPSRTIAVQCDLKLSSVKRADGTFAFDGSQQASSISSTRYGFYKLSPESADLRRKLQRSLSTRILSKRSESESEAGSIKSLTNHHHLNQVEAPTSMSEISTSLSNEHEFVRARFSGREGKKLLKSTSTRQLNDSQVYFDRDYDEEIANIGQVSTSASIASDLYHQRPKTALSYVSTSRLRDSKSPFRSDRSQEEEDHEIQAHRMRARSISHQSLTPSRGAFHRDSETTSCSSDNEQLDYNYGTVENKRHRRQPVQDQFRVPCNEEIQVECDNYEPEVVDYMSSGRVKLMRPASSDLETSTNCRRRNRPNYSKLDRSLSTRQTTGSLRYIDKLVDSSAPHSTGTAPSEISSILHRRPETSHPEAELIMDDELLIDKNRIYAARVAQPYRQSASSQHSRPLNVATSNDYVDGTTGSRSILRESRVSTDNHRLNRKATSSEENSRRYRRTPASSPSNRIDGLPSNCNNVIRSTSLRQMNRTAPKDKYPNQVNVHTTINSNLNPHDQYNEIISRTPTRQQQQASILAYPEQQQQRYYTYTNEQNNLNEYHNYQSSSESSLMETTHHNPSISRLQYLQSSHQQLDFDSQQRLNEIGLPRPTEEVFRASRRRRAHDTEMPASYLGVGGSATSLRHNNDILSRYTADLITMGQDPRDQIITGRAMSQQSLTRPSMPLGQSKRRAGNLNGGPTNFGCDFGVSSMSLQSHLHGRYENAHTRSPVIMYIPQATPRSNSSENGIEKSYSQRGKSTRSSRHMRGSQDRLRRSISRNGSDTESSSSMLRTLVRPRNVTLSRRSSRMNMTNNDDLDDLENVDEIGQLASEMDSFKFKRRYSVPKDAKINWFAKLKNRVSSKL